MEKLLTVTVPCYNSQDYMANCVESLLKGGDRVEIIIIDDGSKDNTAAIADEFAEKYPDIIKVVHQENGGHGEGINVGLKNATGMFFKVVDSDDKLSDDFPRFLDILENEAKDADMVVTNYVYTYNDGGKDNTINYKNIFDENKLLSWDDTRRFKLKQCMTIHSCTFKTQLMRDSGMILPKHVFYEDNLMVCSILPLTEKVFYVNSGLYLYTIGREGQSVSADVMTKRYKHQLLVAAEIFETCHLDDMMKKSKMLYKLMYHEMYMMYAIACMYARRSKEEDAEKNLEDMWKRAYEFDEKYAKKLRKGSSLKFLNIKGKFGKFFSAFIYKLAHSVVKFN
ncbi:MAG: glycosyltransferase family 2 protein [Clostridia bacterium]|nr:glycosyltransferase family 2 protein [Clostridia bacterium]